MRAYSVAVLALVCLAGCGRVTITEDEARAIGERVVVHAQKDKQAAYANAPLITVESKLLRTGVTESRNKLHPVVAEVVYSLKVTDRSLNKEGAGDVYDYTYTVRLAKEGDAWKAIDGEVRGGGKVAAVDPAVLERLTK